MKMSVQEMEESEAAYSCSEKDRIAVIMPVYNEADSIAGTIRELYAKVAYKMGKVDIWIFEDGSIDATKEVLGKLKDEFSSLHVETAAERKGYPKAMKEAFLAIDADEYEYVVAMDSDGQYDPDDIFKLWNVMQSDSPDIVIGRRVCRREPPYRRFFSHGLQLLERVMFPVKCKDVTSVMRLMRVDLAHEIAKEVKYSPYNFWLEFTARMSLNGYNIVEIPISYRERAGGSKVYSAKKMPKVVLSEFRALRAVRREQSNGHVLTNNRDKC
jgi:glycosyltransferase involved in cell wall biosynthesis